MLDPERGYRGQRAEGLDFYLEHMTWKRLPKDVFKNFGGYEAAKQLREERGYGAKKIKADAGNSAGPGECYNNSVNVG